MSHKRPVPDMEIRRLHRGDRAEICEHFLRLGPVSRRSRFCGATSERAVRDYACRVFRRASIDCGASVDRRLRGLVELRAVHDTLSETAEAAFTVEDDWQNLGIGDALFAHILAIAQNRGVRTIQMMCLRDNNRMRRLAAKRRAMLNDDQQVITAVLHPDRPTPASVAKEIVSETRGYAHLLFGLR